RNGLSAIFCIFFFLLGFTFCVVREKVSRGGWDFTGQSLHWFNLINDVPDAAGFDRLQSMYVFSQTGTYGVPFRVRRWKVISAVARCALTPERLGPLGSH